jgi:hypothetical protein
MSKLELLVVGPLRIAASRWPGMDGYDWRGMTNSAAPLNPGGARFGGGWRFKLGVETGGWDANGIHLHFDLLFGALAVIWRTAKGRASDVESDKWWADWRTKEAVQKAVKLEVELKNAERDSLQRTHETAVKELRADLGRQAGTIEDYRFTDAALTEALRRLHDACFEEGMLLTESNIVFGDEEAVKRQAVHDATAHARETLAQYSLPIEPPEAPAPRAATADDDDIPF